jgi:hypothetical protein
MSRSRRPTVAATAVLAAAALLPSAAGAAPDASLRGLVLTGEATCGFKTVHVHPRTPNLFAPLQLMDGDFAPTRQRLFPYQVTVVSGEGLKARHLFPGEIHTRPGQPPQDPVTCVFAGSTREDGDFEVQITGTIRGQ